MGAAGRIGLYLCPTALAQAIRAGKHEWKSRQESLLWRWVLDSTEPEGLGVLVWKG